MNKKVILPRYLQKAVFPLTKGFPKHVKVFACDTETANGKPYMLQFYDGKEITLIEVCEDNVYLKFMEYLRDRCRSKGYAHAVFFHNLQFDMTAILCKSQDMFQYLKPPNFVCEDGAGNEIGDVELYAQKTWWGKVHLSNGVNVDVVDSARFFIGSLHDISRKLGLEHLKPERPKGVQEGKEVQSLSDPEFKAYVEQEIMSEYDLAMHIIQMHKDYDVGLSISSSDYSSKVFKKHYLHVPIPQCPSWIVGLAEQSLHGGRASNFVDGINVIPDVKLYDYNSFYPYTMTIIPPFTSGRWYSTNSFVDDYEGLYWIDGIVKNCKWPIILKNAGDFAYARNEYVRNVPITSYELREALRSGEFEPEKIRGYIWKPWPDSTNPFLDYVTDFYLKKNNADKGNPEYTTYKLLLNQLYGKTYQTIRTTDYEETPEYDWNNGDLRRSDIEYRAGGIYLPHVGSWITSSARAILHRDLHSYEAIMCATDSILTTKNAKTGKELGQLKLECEGMALIIKPKLYFIFSKAIQKEVESEGSLRGYLGKELDGLTIGEDIVKFATHGYWATPKHLLEMYVNGETDYSIRHMNKIRESLRQKKDPRVMEDVHRSVNIDWYDEKGFCKMRIVDAMRTKELCNGQCFSCAYNF